MKRVWIGVLAVVGVGAAILLPKLGQANGLSSQGSYQGTVEQVWEDGFKLNTGDRTFRVDTWDLYGDNTPSQVSVGDRVTITGEFENGEFDAFTLTPTP